MVWTTGIPRRRAASQIAVLIPGRLCVWTRSGAARASASSSSACGREARSPRWFLTRRARSSRQSLRCRTIRSKEPPGSRDGKDCRSDTSAPLASSPCPRSRTSRSAPPDEASSPCAFAIRMRTDHLPPEVRSSRSEVRVALRRGGNAEPDEQHPEKRGRKAGEGGARDGIDQHDREPAENQPAGDLEAPDGGEPQHHEPRKQGDQDEEADDADVGHRREVSRVDRSGSLRRLRRILEDTELRTLGGGADLADAEAEGNLGGLR